MKAFQRIIREKRQAEDADVDLFGKWWEGIALSLVESKIRPIDLVTAASVIEKYEWLGVMPGWSRFAFGHFFEGNLGGVCVLGDTTGSHNAFQKVFPNRKIIQLQRGAHVWWTPKNSASYFTSNVCRWIKKNTEFEIITATCDTSAGEIGTIYQSLNWKYIGEVTSGGPFFIINGKEFHPKTLFDRHGTCSISKMIEIYGNSLKLKTRQIKHRYMLPLYRHIKIEGKPYPKRAEQVSSRDTVETIDRARGSSSVPLQNGRPK